MDTVRINVIEGLISISFIPLVSKWSATRYVSAESALEISALMMRAGLLPNVMTVCGFPRMVFQVAEGKDRMAWLGMQDWEITKDKHLKMNIDLVAYIEGDAVIDIGQCFNQLYMELTYPGMMEGDFSIFTRPVSKFCLYDWDANTHIWDLASRDPRPHYA